MGKAGPGEVRLPDLGEVDEVTVVKWHKQEGETLKAGEELVEVDTEKTTFVIEAPQAGRLNRIIKQEGQKVHLDDLLAEIE
jgi:pyruvate/2-oxoglutarate dehydrogenase complex dihydrolipoamide acyltransferase (E2) component